MSADPGPAVSVHLCPGSDCCDAQRSQEDSEDSEGALSHGKPIEARRQTTQSG